jgi:hypothetical protein
MKHYESPELVELGDAIELTLGTRPGENLDQNGAEFNPPFPQCVGCDGPGDPLPK